LACAARICTARVGLVKAGLAEVRVERLGRPAIEVAHVRISDKGREALASSSLASSSAVLPLSSGTAAASKASCTAHRYIAASTTTFAKNSAPKQSARVMDGVTISRREPRSDAPGHPKETCSHRRRDSLPAARSPPMLRCGREVQCERLCCSSL
jgi:hypothetical protein